SETEYGTLRSYAAINFNYQVSGSGTTGYDMEDGVSIEHAYIELGGFRIGKTDSYFSTFTDYSSGVMNDGIVPYGPFGTLQIAYTYTGANGFSAGVAIEQGDQSDIAYRSDIQADGQALGGITQDYAPFVVGGLSFTQGWGKIGVVAGYDSWQSEVAVKGRLDVNITETASVFVMGAWDSAGFDNENYYAQWAGDWAVWGGTAIKFNEKATFNAEVGYDDGSNFSVAANVAYELVPGFTITPEVVYYDPDKDSKGNQIVDADGDEVDDSWGFNLRFQRTF
ncbi:porin, partial [Mesorhizobium sp. IMUNJ 23232]|uniref:porin n=1 Tax=Mesorhizobium sp. IMUNJ 23232 TaxID=3376064 RepID=UPI0037A5A9EE